MSVAVRTGDTPQRDRQRMLRTPPDILITTPESLYLLLTSRGTEILTDIRAVIVDEIHAVAGTKRGTHLALSLERLDRLVSGAGEASSGSACRRRSGRWPRSRASWAARTGRGARAPCRSLTPGPRRSST